MVLDNFTNVKENHFVKVSFIPYNPETHPDNNYKIIAILLVSIMLIIVVINIKRKKIYKI